LDQRSELHLASLERHLELLVRTWNWVHILLTITMARIGHGDDTEWA
jgi:hypothetical protein